jgi:hypothetical protein
LPLRERSRAAFLAAYPVFQHPRCLNCHPAGDSPLQGDDSHPHEFLVQRGPAGQGVTAMKCGNCHQASNRPEPHAPPGTLDWHLPPPRMRMTFQGRSAAELCRQLEDPARNGGRTSAQVLDHLDTELVRWAWDPGPGRTSPPLGYAEFVARMKEWAATGAACPE